MPKPHRPAKLTADQIPLWAANYIQDFNGARVAREFGYAEGSARRRAAEIMEDPDVQAAVKAAIEKRTAKAERTAEKVLDKIDRIHGLALENDKLQTALKACELEGKHLGMFTDKIKVEGLEPLVIELPLAGKSITLTTKEGNGE